MGEGLIRSLKLASRTLVRHQIVLSAGLSVAAGIILRSLLILPVGNPFFHYVALERPDVYRAFVWSFTLFLFTTPYLVLSMCFSLVYIHFYEEEIERATGFLPPYPQPGLREDMFLIVGERHQQLDPIPAVHPQWLSIPERGLYTGTLAVGCGPHKFHPNESKSLKNRPLERIWSQGEQLWIRPCWGWFSLVSPDLSACTIVGHATTSILRTQGTCRHRVGPVR